MSSDVIRASSGIDPKPQLDDTTLRARARRVALAMGYLLMPERIGDLPFLLAAMANDLVRRPPDPPDSSRIRRRPAGFAGVARDLSTPTVIEAARRGFYPGEHFAPMKWWSPPERGVLPIDELHITKRFRRLMRNTEAVVTFDRSFREVVERCAAPRAGQSPLTWLTPRTRALWCRVHDAGHAHSVEVWTPDRQLVGGCFGLRVGPVFSAYSLFHTVDNASKLALVSLCHHLGDLGVTVVDTQVATRLVKSMGGRKVPREAFEAMLLVPPSASDPAVLAPGPWTARYALVETAAWQPGASPTES